MQSAWHEHNVNYTVMKNMNIHLNYTQTNLKNIYRVRQKDHTFPTENWENETEVSKNRSLLHKTEWQTIRKALAKFQLNQ